MLGKIGKGVNSEVYKMRRLSDDKIVACKRIPYEFMDSKQKHQLVEEVNILREMKSTHIVKYYGHIVDKVSMSIYLIMEFCEVGDLDAYLRETQKEKALLPEHTIWRIFMQVVLALQEVHKRKEVILHRDIKPANILLDAQSNVKLGDFGLARRLNNEENFAQTRLEQTYYLSPEQLKEGIFTEKTDIWALGCLLYQMATLKPPFYGDNQMQVALNIKNGKLEPIPNQYSKELWRVIRWCLSRNPSDRPDSSDLTHVPELARKLRERRYT